MPEPDVSLEDARARNLMLTRAQVGEWLQIPVGTLAGWAYRGEGPPYSRVGKHCRYRPSDVEAWIEKQRIDPSEGRYRPW